MDLLRNASGAYHAMLALESYIHKALPEETALLNLLRTRASQINGCAYCIDMHSKDARADGETEQRLYALDAWRETPFFTDKERAALAWTEAITLVHKDHVPDDVFQDVRRFFSEEKLADLTLAIAAINSWNRLSIAFRAVPGQYQPSRQRTGTEG
jgi:AhpD family alkylhydroperoxidase